MDEDYLIKTMFITSNIASSFEDEKIRGNWFEEIRKAIELQTPDLVMLHFQEVGGLNFTSAADDIRTFVEDFLKLPVLKKYTRAQAFMDHNFEMTAEYTAMGCIYLIHERVVEVNIWNFPESSFQPVSGITTQVLTKSDQMPPFYRMQRFPSYFYPDAEWTRKGYLWSRWQINGMVFDVINVHLFHDKSNLVAMDATPSSYFSSRKRALDWTVHQIVTKGLSEAPMVMFGDFNFRIDLCSVVKSIREVTDDVEEVRSPDGYLTELIYTQKRIDTENGDETKTADSKLLLRIGIETFDLGSDNNSFFEEPSKWTKYDLEQTYFQNVFFEFPVRFPPTYCFDCSSPAPEDPSGEGEANPHFYGHRRAPSWCDRILLSHSFRSLIAQERHLFPEYGILARDVQVGDHKPVFLLLRLRQTPGDWS